MSEYTDWLNKDSLYIKIKEGESYIVIFNGRENGEYNDKPTVHYKFDKKTFSSSSKKLSEKMDNIPLGSKIKIQKFGTGTNTVYEVEVLETGKAPEPEVWDEEK